MTTRQLLIRRVGIFLAGGLATSLGLAHLFGDHHRGLAIGSAFVGWGVWATSLRGVRCVSCGRRLSWGMLWATDTFWFYPYSAACPHCGVDINQDVPRTL